MISVYFLTPVVYFGILEPLFKWLIRKEKQHQAYLRSLPPVERDHRGIPVNLLKDGKHLTPEAIKYLKTLKRR